MIIWLSLFFIIVLVFLIKQGKVSSLTDLTIKILKVLLHPIMIISIAYTILLFFFFNYINLINTIELVKEYFKLAIFALLPMIFKVISQFDQIELTNMIKGTIKFSIIPLFIINEYTFHIYWELFIVLIATIITILLAVSETDPKFKPLKKFFNGCLVVIGLLIFIFAYGMFFSNLEDVQATVFWKKMLLELLLICHVPLLKIVQLNGYYEIILGVLKVTSKLGYSCKSQFLILLILLSNCQLNKRKLDQALKKVRINRVNSYKELNLLLKIN